MKKKLLLLCLPFLILVGCGKGNGPSETKAQETQQEVQSEETVSEAVENIEYIDGFEKAEHEKFNSYASDNGLAGTAVCVEGKVLNQTRLGDSEPPILALTIEQEDGKRWTISLVSDSEIEELEKKNVRVFGSYQGFSDVMNLPAVAVMSEDYNIMSKARVEIKENNGYKTVWSCMDYIGGELEKEGNGDVAEKQESIGETEKNPEEVSQPKDPFFSYSGNGDDIISDVHTDSISYAHITHEGDGHFAVKGHYGSGYDLLVNTTEPYDGLTLIYPNQDYVFEITARGDWSIELWEVGTSLTDSFSGDSDFVSPIFAKAYDVYEVTTVGGGHFALRGWTDSGYDLLVNTTDENYSGKVMFKKDGEYAFFEVNASREWEIKPSK